MDIEGAGPAANRPLDGVDDQKRVPPFDIGHAHVRKRRTIGRRCVRDRCGAVVASIPEDVRGDLQVSR